MLFKKQSENSKKNLGEKIICFCFKIELYKK